MAVIVNQTEVKSAETEEPHWPFLCMLDFAKYEAFPSKVSIILATQCDQLG